MEYDGMLHLKYQRNANIFVVWEFLNSFVHSGATVLGIIDGLEIETVLEAPK